MPYRPGALLMPGAEKIKEIATTLPHVAVPAGATRSFGLIDSERRVTILAIGVMFSKGTTAQPTLIKPDILTNQIKGVLGSTPSMDGATGTVESLEIS